MSVSRFAKKEIVPMLSRSGPMSRLRVGHIEGLINLGAGDPDFNQPELINKAVLKAMRSGDTHYDFGGNPEFKVAIAEYYKKYGVEVDPGSQVLITSGGSQAIFQAFGAILNPGDEMLIMDPAYHGYKNPTAYFGAKMIRAKLVKDTTGQFRPNLNNIRNAITDKTKALLICNPDNPVGTVYTREELEGIAKLAVERDIIVISDEIYTEFVWGSHSHMPIINLPGMWERTMVLMSFSKTFAWTGCRAGYIIAGPELMKVISKVPIGICGVPVPFQKAGIVALSEAWDFVEEMRQAYKKRLDYMVPRLNEINGLKCPYPNGAFYLFVDISQLGVSSMKFSQDLFQNEKVRCSPGIQYGEGGEDHIRFALVKSVEDLEEAADRIERFVNSLPT
jgi:aminotransferase